MENVNSVDTIVDYSKRNALVASGARPAITFSDLRVMVDEIERLRALNEQLSEKKDESAQDWYLISLSDEMAKSAMTAVLSNPVYAEWDDETLSKSCWSLTDAMMKERGKRA